MLKMILQRLYVYSKKNQNPSFIQRLNFLDVAGTSNKKLKSGSIEPRNQFEDRSNMIDQRLLRL